MGYSFLLRRRGPGGAMLDQGFIVGPVTDLVLNHGLSDTSTHACFGAEDLLKDWRDRACEQKKDTGTGCR